MITVNEIANEFDLSVSGDSDKSIVKIATPGNQSDNAIAWAKNKEKLIGFKTGIVVCNSKDFNLIEPEKDVTYLLTKEITPRLVFARILHAFFMNNGADDFVNEVDMHRQNTNVLIGENVFIGPNVIIGDGTRIHHNAVVYSNTVIGENCIINSHASIGTEGLGLEFDPEKNRYLKFPQIGGVVLEDFVEIGPNTTIRRAALENTVIRQGTKIGSMCNVGHNCVIGRNCILTCNVIISGSSVIGDNVFMGVSSLVRNRINIGNNVTLGQGAVVVKNIPDDETWIGNPAKKFSK